MQAQKDIVNRKMLGHDDITSSEDCGIEKDYQKFLQDSNCMDFCDIYNVFKQEFDKNEELQKEIEKQTFVFLDVPKSKAEVSAYTLHVFCDEGSLTSGMIDPTVINRAGSIIFFPLLFVHFIILPCSINDSPNCQSINTHQFKKQIFP